MRPMSTVLSLAVLLVLALFVADGCSKKSTAPQGRVLDSRDIAKADGSGNGGGSYQKTFDATGTFNYHCERHSVMKARVEVIDPGPAASTVNINGATSAGFDPNPVTVGRNGTVTWTNRDAQVHTVTSDL